MVDHWLPLTFSRLMTAIRYNLSFTLEQTKATFSNENIFFSVNDR